MKDEPILDTLSLHIPVVGQTTSRGYGIALAHPVERKGLICWYKDARAYLIAAQDTAADRLAGRDASELYFADEIEVFRNGDEAVKALIRYARE